MSKIINTSFTKSSGATTVSHGGSSVSKYYYYNACASGSSPMIWFNNYPTGSGMWITRENLEPFINLEFSSGLTNSTGNGILIENTGLYEIDVGCTIGLYNDLETPGYLNMRFHPARNTQGPAPTGSTSGFITTDLNSPIMFSSLLNPGERAISTSSHRGIYRLISGDTIETAFINGGIGVQELWAVHLSIRSLE